jgi:hypothetical protein
MRQEEDPSTKPAPASVANHSQHGATDEVLQRLVNEAGSDKRLESRRADRKAFFDSHWALPKRELAPKPGSQVVPKLPLPASVNDPESSYKRSTIKSNAPDNTQLGAVEDAELQNQNISAHVQDARKTAAPTESPMTSRDRDPPIARILGRRPRTREGYTENTDGRVKQAETILAEKETKKSTHEIAEDVHTASPPPEPADKTSEEWISWKRARLSEGARNIAKRKREREERGGAEVGTHQRKKSKVEDGSSGAVSVGTGNIGQRDEVMGEGDEEEKDVVDQLLEQWTVPV